ncbi:MAG: hypothetical protein ABIG34_04825 [Candidatus Peregrinibacteria bacterium]
MDSSKEKVCPFCAEIILLEAKKCKHCSSILGKQATTVELTSKSIKLQLVLSIVAVIVGWFVLLQGFQEEEVNTFIVTIGIFIVIGGTVSYFWAKIARWWYHS